MTPAAPRLRVVVLISGSGSNLQALIDAIDGGRLLAEIVLVVSNYRSAYGLERARQAGMSRVMPMAAVSHWLEPSLPLEMLSR